MHKLICDIWWHKVNLLLFVTNDIKDQSLIISININLTTNDYINIINNICLNGDTEKLLAMKKNMHLPAAAACMDIYPCGRRTSALARTWQRGGRRPSRLGDIGVERIYAASWTSFWTPLLIDRCAFYKRERRARRTNRLAARCCMLCWFSSSLLVLWIKHI